MNRQELLDINTRIAEVIALALSISLEDTQASVKSAHNTREHHNTLVSMIDPTRYRQDAPAVNAAYAVVRAFLDFRQVLEDVRAK